MRKNNNIKATEKELISLAPTYEAQDTETIYKKYIDETLSEREYNNSEIFSVDDHVDINRCHELYENPFLYNRNNANKKGC